MSFDILGGLGAAGAGRFAAVCLIRHRSEVTPVSSTYLWRLSEQRRKKKGYWRTLKRSLFFALQFFGADAFGAADRAADHAHARFGRERGGDSRRFGEHADGGRERTDALCLRGGRGGARHGQAAVGARA